MSKFRIGDKVKVVDSGEHYSSYAEWVALHAPSLLQEWKNGRHYAGPMGTIKSLKLAGSKEG